MRVHCVCTTRQEYIRKNTLEFSKGGGSSSKYLIFELWMEVALTVRYVWLPNSWVGNQTGWVRSNWTHYHWEGFRASQEEGKMDSLACYYERVTSHLPGVQRVNIRGYIHVSTQGWPDNHFHTVLCVGGSILWAKTPDFLVWFSMTPKDTPLPASHLMPHKT